MYRVLAKLILLCVMFVAGTAGLYYYETHNTAEARLTQEMAKNEQLRLVVQRLHAETRRAEAIVVEQKPSGTAGEVKTTLLFVEYDKSDNPLPAKRVTFEGKEAHIDAMVVKFKGKYVEENDPLRGRSVALFTRIFGNKQTPEQAARLDEPGKVPAVYRTADPAVAAFEQQLWKDFWRLADDQAYRDEMGVHVAQGESVWRPFEPGKLYHITLESDGGVNITAEPLRGIYRAALERELEL